MQHKKHDASHRTRSYGITQATVPTVSCHDVDSVRGNKFSTSIGVSRSSRPRSGFIDQGRFRNVGWNRKEDNGSPTFLLPLTFTRAQRGSRGETLRMFLNVNASAMSRRIGRKKENETDSDGKGRVERRERAKAREGGRTERWYLIYVRRGPPAAKEMIVTKIYFKLFTVTTPTYRG